MRPDWPSSLIGTALYILDNTVLADTSCLCQLFFSILDMGNFLHVFYFVLTQVSPSPGFFICRSKSIMRSSRALHTALTSRRGRDPPVLRIQAKSASPARGRRRQSVKLFIPFKLIFYALQEIIS